MRIPRSAVLLLAAAPLLAATAPSLKPTLKVHLIREQGAAARVTLETRGIFLWQGHPADSTGKPAQRASVPFSAPAELLLLGMGTADIVAADSGRSVVAEIERSVLMFKTRERVSGRVVHIRHVEGAKYEVRGVPKVGN